MAITSVNVLRVSENLKSLRLLESLKQNTLKLYNEQNRLATGYKFLTPSENPTGASTAMRMSQILEQQDQILTNLKHADSFMSATDQAIQDINTLLMDAHDLASANAGDMASQEEREAAAIEINALIDQLVLLGNRTFQGRYLFGGQATKSAPFTREDGYVKYVGDTHDLKTRIDENQDGTYNITGNMLFGAVSSQVSGWKDWGVRLTGDTRVCDCRGTTGKGIGLGTIRITETAVADFTVDLRQADSISDIVDMINDAAATAGSTVTASINPAGTGIRLTSGGPTIEVNETAGGYTARDLGLLTAGPVAVVPGGDIDPKLTERTQLQDLSGVNVADLAAGFVITNGRSSVTIDTGTLLATDTVQDLLRLINASDIGIEAQINADATGIDIVNRISGQAMTIGENGGNTATALGIRSLHGGTSLATLNNGKGVSTVAGQADFRIVARNGVSIDVDLNDAAGGLDYNGDGVETLDDVIDAINDAATAAGVAVTASLAATGNGIRLVDATGVNGTLSVQRLNLSYAVDDLGLTNLQVSGAGASVDVVGKDVNGIVPDGVFTALQELYEALIAGDSRRITEAGGDIERVQKMVVGRLGEVGARAKALNDRLTWTEQAVDATKKVLSEVRDLDYTEAVTKFQQAQTALQANLMTSAQLMNLSLLDFL